MRRVTTLAQIYDSLLGVGLSETIDLGDYLRALCASLPELQDRRNRRVDLVCRADSIPLALDVVTALGMVVAELVTNSYGTLSQTGREDCRHPGALSHRQRCDVDDPG